MSLFISTGGKGLKFQNPGDTHSGTVSRPPREQQMTKFGTQDPDFWSNGDPKMQVIVELDTAERDPSDTNDDGSRTLYVSSSAMKRAIGDAILAAGADDIEVGGTLTLTFTGFDPASKNPQNPKKLYHAGYARPTSPLAPQGQATPAAAPAPSAAQAQQAAWNQAPQAVAGQQDPWNPPTPPGAQGGGFPGHPAQPQFAPTPAAAPQAGQQQFAGQGMPAPATAPAPAAAPAPAPAAASSSLTGLPVDVENKLQQLMQVLPPEQILPLMAGDGVTQQHIDQLSSF